MNRKAITRDTGTARGQSEQTAVHKALALSLSPLAASLALALAAPLQAHAQTGATDAVPAGTSAPAGTTLPSGTGLTPGDTGQGLSLPDLGGGRRIDPPVLLPGVRASTTLTDNVGLASAGEEADLFFEVSPYLIASSQRPGATYNVSYQLRNFFRVGDGEFNLFRHNLAATGSFALISDNLWLDASGYMGSVATSIGGALSTDQTATFGGNTSRFRSFTVSPWYRNNLGRFASYNLRYSYTQTSGNTGLTLADSTQSVSGSIAGIDVGRDWNWQAFGNFQRQFYTGGFERDRRGSGVNLSYRVSHTLMVRAGAVYDQIDGVRNEEGDDFGWGPLLGFDWNPNSRLSVSAEIADRYYGTSGSARVAWSTARSTTGIQFTRGIITNADSALLAINPLALTANPLGLPNDVLSSLLASGVVLPTGLPITSLLITDSAQLESRFTAFWGLRGASRSLTLSAWWSKRENGYTLNQPTTSVGGIRGTTTAATSFLQEIRERGLALTGQQRLDGRSSLEASIDRRIVETPTLGTETTLTTLRAGVSTVLDSKTTAFAGIRHAQQSASGSGARYDENAVYGGIDMKFK